MWNNSSAGSQGFIQRTVIAYHPDDLTKHYAILGRTVTLISMYSTNSSTKLQKIVIAKLRFSDWLREVLFVQWLCNQKILDVEKQKYHFVSRLICSNNAQTKYIKWSAYNSLTTVAVRYFRKFVYFRDRPQFQNENMADIIKGTAGNPNYTNNTPD